MDIRTVRRTHEGTTWIHLGRRDRTDFDAVVYVNRREHDVHIHVDGSYETIDEAKGCLEVLQRAVEIAEREKEKLEEK